MHYKPFADGVKHFKETEKGRKVMCELVEKYAENRAENRAVQTMLNNVTSLMETTNMTLEQALDALKIQDKERELIIHQLQK